MNWISMKERMPDANQLVVLANCNRWKSDDVLGCRKDVGALKQSGHGFYWSTHGEMRAMSSEAFTHWLPLPSEPSDNCDAT